ncbi:MAG: lipoprotein insertase outer membrane protein LolB [Gammaproteobacteria bacterium]|nr:lipoprotein insertase outer membrane protein LolB [Gammaproteobacteria bacterium]
MLLFTGCANQPQLQPSPTITTSKPQIEQLQNWVIKGKLGVRGSRDSGSANLIWQQLAQNYRIYLSGPLGSGATVITGSPNGVSLQRGGDTPIFAATPELLTTEVMGWPLPVAKMFYWLRGLAAPGASSNRQQNANGQLQSLRQAGWQLSFDKYQTVSGYQLPTRIKAVSHQAGDPINVTLVVKQWQPQ